MRLIEASWSEMNDAVHLVFSWKADQPAPAWEHIGETGELRLHVDTDTEHAAHVAEVLAELFDTEETALQFIQRSIRRPYP